MPLKKFSRMDIFDFIYIGAIIPEQKTYESPELSESFVLDNIQSWLATFIESNPNWALKLSCGLDSRLLLFLLKELGISELKVHTYFNPELGIDLDADVYCAKSILKALGIKADHELKPGHPNKYLIPFNQLTSCRRYLVFLQRNFLAEKCFNNYL